MSQSRASSPEAAASSVTLLASLKTQARIIGALLMREIITRYGRHNIGFMWVFVEPMMFTTGVLILWSALGLHNNVALPIVPFTLTGYATVLLWRNTISRCGNAIEPNRTLMHHRNVRVIDFFISRIILEITGASMSFLILAVLLGLIGFAPVPDNLLEILVGWFLLAWFCSGMALIIGSLSVLSEVVDRIWHVASYLFLPLSGAFSMVNWLPLKFQSILLWVPTVSCVELIREGLFGSSINAKYDIFFVMICNMSLMLPGLLLVRYVAQRVEGE